MTGRAEILRIATETVSGNRENHYGPPEDNFGRIADYWNTYLGDRLSHSITPADVAWLMVLLKIARNSHKFGLDNAVDAAGYAALAGELSE